MLDLQIGTQFYCEDKLLEVIEDTLEDDNPCHKCFFNNKESESYFSYIAYCDMVKCRPQHERYDKKSVIFKEIK